MRKNIKKMLGFTLVEMAIVLVILGTLLIAFLTPLRAQRDIALQLETQATLENAKKALYGFAQTNGRLPCPASNENTGIFPDDTGTSRPDASGDCDFQVGFLPGRTLGVQPLDSQGFVLDAWNNRVRYAVTQTNVLAIGAAATADFTTNSDMDVIGIANLNPDLQVCPAAGCAVNASLINNAAAVIFSLGQTGTLPSGGVDEDQNLAASPNAVFVSHASTSNAAVNGEFDHIVTWISPYMLYHAMIETGQLR